MLYLFTGQRESFYNGKILKIAKAVDICLASFFKLALEIGIHFQWYPLYNNFYCVFLASLEPFDEDDYGYIGFQVPILKTF